MALESKHCVPCAEGTPKLHEPELSRLRSELNRGWTVQDGHHLEREFKFKDFREALTFTNAVGELAERENHHPDIYLAWGIVRLTIWTHKIDGLSESDFILAKKVDQIAERKA